MIQELLNMLSELNLKKVSQNVEKFTDLYFKPIKVWKNIFNRQKTSLDVLVFYIFFWSIIIFFITGSVKGTITYISLLIFSCLLPFLILLIPFLFFKKKWNKKIKVNRLFRLCMIITLQILPIALFSQIISNFTKTEVLYILIPNAQALGELLCIIVIPICVNINSFKKIIWISTNYIFFNLSMVILSFLIPSLHSDFEKIGNDFLLKMPFEEYEEIQKNQKFSYNLLLENVFITEYETIEGEKFKTNIQPIFPSINIIDYLAGHTKKINRNINKKIRGRNLKFFDSIIKSEVNKSKLNPEKINTIIKDFDKKFYFDLNYLDSIKGKIVYKSNKDYVNKIHGFLKFYNETYLDSTFILKTLKNEKPKIVFNISNNRKLLFYEFINTRQKISYQNIESLSKKQDKRISYSFFIRKILYYPMYLLTKRKERKLINRFENLKNPI